ncbi:hypothetical protein HMPREF1869_00363 [Bacteroidales bacterium KA00251]|nr:hypothetical protein HMPREF1869_00363 [Bacteroidales bacterium KA00251]
MLMIPSSRVTLYFFQKAISSAPCFLYSYLSMKNRNIMEQKAF